MISKYMYSVLSALAWRPIASAAFSRLSSRELAWADEVARSAMLLRTHTVRYSVRGIVCFLPFPVYKRSLITVKEEIFPPKQVVLLMLWTNSTTSEAASHQQKIISIHD